MSVLLKKSPFRGISPKELAEQIESKKKCQKKLPTWFNTLGIYYPKKIHIEQTSSEISADYKSKIVVGKSLLDMTGGLGIDSYYFSKKIDQIFYCEIEEELAQIASHNFEILGRKNIHTFAENGLKFLKKSERKFDWIYIDPSRRNETDGRVFQLTDSLPDVPKNLNLLFNKVENVLVKTSPLLDISAGIKELKFTKEIHVLAIENEVKELLWVLNKEFLGDILIKTINISKSSEQVFQFLLCEEKNATSNLSATLTYLYEPNAAILKAGAFKLVGSAYNLKKLHQHTHLFTSEELIEFPGRRFKIEKILPFNKKSIKELNIEKANIATRNFPESVSLIRRKFKIKDGGDQYLFFLKEKMGGNIMLQCSKI